MRSIEPKILYFGTPVALISSWNDDRTTNLAPISSFWTLGWTMTLGLLDETKTAENLARHPECVVNLPAPSMWKMVEKLAPLTGKDPVPELKAKQFRTEKDKFAAGGFSRRDGEIVQPSRAAECPIQMEARVLSMHEMGGSKLKELGGGIVAIVEILRVHADESYLKDGSDHIDPDKWSPLVYNFRHYFDLSDHELGKTFRA
jgi:flavin reductase (DIM6/NTAB) family NADH-FMN oxidoreductase RutF